MIIEFEKGKKNEGQHITRIIVNCKECDYFKPFKDAKGYGECRSKHTFDGAFRETDFCSYAKFKETK